jgi:Na+-driven multidrug efflux pump
MKKIILALGIMAVMALGWTGGGVVAADNICKDTPPAGIDGAEWAEMCGKNGGDVNSIAKPVINTMLLIIGMIAVGAIVLGAIQYATSAGDASKVTKAKNTITYAIIGLIVAALAYAIVQFVLDRL